MKRALALLLSTAVQAALAIPVLVVDHSGKEIVRDVERGNYSQGLAKLMQGAEEESIDALERARVGRDWKLTSVSVGVGLSLTVGLWPFFQAGLAPRFSVNFCRVTDTK